MSNRLNTDELLRAKRLNNEIEHSQKILASDERNWGWNTPAGAIRWNRRVSLLKSFETIDGSAPKVLEIGCGTGTFTGELSQKYKNLTAIDIAPDLIEKAKQKNPTVKFEIRDAHHTEFQASSFDLVCGCSVLHHLNWTDALVEIFRILKPNGKILFSEPNLSNPQIFLQKNWSWLKEKMGDSPDEYAFTPGQIRQALLSAGFSHIEVKPYEFLHPSTPKSLIGVVQMVEQMIERTPIVNIGGSISIQAQRK